MRTSQKLTITACLTGFVVQAIVINYSPLLFLTFENELGISMAKISLLISISFITQLLMDLTASRLPHLFSKRVTIVMGQVCAALGLMGIALLPSVLPPYVGLIIGTTVASVGGGIIEVTGNPVIESCNIKNKHAILTFMHSCYCWGVVLTVLLSTVFFYLLGTEHWRLLTCLWAAIPACNAVLFAIAPLGEITAAPDRSKRKRSAFRTFTFWALIVLMLCAGAAEQVMAQWASSFAEMGLGVDKTMGDILGPCAFALLMGLARLLYAKFSTKIDLSKCMIATSVLCIVGYLLSAFSPFPALSLVGCAVCGFSVGLMWPGTLCIATEEIPDGGVKMFALLALAGDAGCAIGPSAAGWIAGALGDDLKIAFALSAVFPLLIIVFAALLMLRDKRRKAASIKK